MGATAHRLSLTRRLARRIQREGPLTLAAYMAAVLTDREQGYYMTRDPLGAPRTGGGDFITAPEISQMFGELIGLWCVDFWRRWGCPKAFLLVELGPGRGTLFADALRAARLDPAFRQAVRLHLVEISPPLRALQGRALADAAPTWHDNLGQVPDKPGIVIANEFFDALPVRQFEKSAEGWRERLVALDPARETLVLAPGPVSALNAHLIPEGLREAANGSVVEVSPAALALASVLGTRAARHGGCALILDYGPERSETGATLQAVRQHHSQDILDEPGEADLTAHVRFAEISQAAAAPGARTYGPVPQGSFLSRLGIAARAEQLLEHAEAAQAETIRAALRRLVDPGEMGLLFKALAITGPNDPEPAGFA